MDDLVQVKGKLDTDTISKYRQLEKALIEALKSTQQILLALGQKSGNVKFLKSSVPMLDDLKEFLTQYGKPAPQFEIIKAVGEVRKRRTPELVRPYLDVWKSLIFYDRHNREIVVVEETKEGIRRGKLKDRPPSKGPRLKPLGGDSPEHYREPNNLFWFVSEIPKARR